MDNTILSNESPKPLSIWQMLGLHLDPGVIIMVFFFLPHPLLSEQCTRQLCRYFWRYCFPHPVRAWFLYYQGKKLNGRYSLEGVVLLRERIPTWQFVLLVFRLVSWGGLAFGLLTVVDNFFVQAMNAGFLVGRRRQT